MDNIEVIEVENALTNQTQKFLIIDRGNGNFTSMLKSDYDKQQAQAEHFTPMIPGDE
jgi:hypothetical protein